MKTFQDIKIIDTSKMYKLKNNTVYPVGMCCQDVYDDSVQEKILCIGDDCDKNRIIV